MADLDATVNAYLVGQLKRKKTYRTVESPTDAGGLGVSRQKWQSPLYEFQLTVGFPTKALSDAFLTFFDGKKGAKGRFTWTHPHENVVYTCKFASDALEETWDGLDWWEYTFSLFGQPQ